MRTARRQGNHETACSNPARAPPTKATKSQRRTLADRPHDEKATWQWAATLRNGAEVVFLEELHADSKELPYTGVYGEKYSFDIYDLATGTEFTILHKNFL